VQLKKRVAALEANTGEQAIRVVWRETWQTDAEALDAFGRDQIGPNDHVIMVSYDGGRDAAA
jgi:hypothetical protein